MKRIAVFLVQLLAIQSLTAALTGAQAFAAESNSVQTRYTTIRFDDPADLNLFIFRIGGQNFDFIANKDLASSKIDRLIDRVQAILDMHVSGLKIIINVKRGDLNKNETAYYDTKTHEIYVSCDKVTDGVFAHETAHAIINEYLRPRQPARSRKYWLSMSINNYGATIEKAAKQEDIGFFLHISGVRSAHLRTNSSLA